LVVGIDCLGCREVFYSLKRESFGNYETNHKQQKGMSKK